MSTMCTLTPIILSGARIALCLRGTSTIHVVLGYKFTATARLCTPGFPSWRKDARFFPSRYAYNFSLPYIPANPRPLPSFEHPPPFLHPSPVCEIGVQNYPNLHFANSCALSPQSQSVHIACPTRVFSRLSRD